MDCLRSFTQQISVQSSLVGLNSTQSFWTSGPNIHCSAIATFAAGVGPAVFLPQGFKNIDVYAIKMTGTIISDPNNLTDGGIVSDWGVILNTGGTYSQLGGVYSNQAITVNQSPQTISLSKYAGYLEFPSPIKSISNISINNLYIQANYCQVNTDLAILGELQFTTFYKFEGE